jgi:hypothetical protein
MTRFKARVAGFFYILLLPIGAIQFMFGRLPASNNAAAAAANIVAHPSVVQTAFATDLLIIVCYLVVTAVLYEMFKPVSSTVSLLAAFFDLIGCAVQAFTSLFRIAPLFLLTSIPREQVQTLAYLLLKLYTPSYRIGLVFFAFHMVLIGFLIIKSTFMPRLLGVLVMIAGLGWLAFLWPPLADLLWPRVLMPLDAGELCLMLWLLIRGVNVERWNAQKRTPNAAEV